MELRFRLPFQDKVPSLLLVDRPGTGRLKLLSPEATDIIDLTYSLCGFVKIASFSASAKPLLPKLQSKVIHPLLEDGHD